MKNLTLSLIICFSVLFPAKAITIIHSAAWLESAYITWTPVENTKFYEVSYTGSGVVNKVIDTQLVRAYGSYFRADAVGIAAGTYTFKVVAIDSADVRTDSIASQSLTVLPHDRSGFAFMNSRVPGAYNADGTPKANAVILYITQNTKNTVSLNVANANSNPCVGLQAILDGFKKGKDNRPLIIRLIGQITDLTYMLGGDIVIENDNNAASYITFEGIGNDAVADGWGIRLKNASNVEIRNLGFMNCNSDEGDNVGLQQSNDYIWVHHCDMFYGHAGGDADQAKGDGALDCKKSTFVTFSYNHFWDSGKCNLLGNGGETPGYITFHHNWYDHSDSRHPRVREHNVHIYNNYYDGNSKYGAGATTGASLFVEGNFFRNCKKPMLISMQGSDISGGSGTFSSEDGGIIKAYNNTMEGTYSFVPYSTANTVEFDAYVVTDKTEQIPATIKTKKGNKTYSNFDTNSTLMYSYTTDSPENAKANTMLYAGRAQGGDFQWVFNNAVDDNDYDVNIALKNALASYQTSLVAVQGESNESGGGEEGGSTGEVTGNGGGLCELMENSNSGFTVQGNTSDSKGSVTVNGITYSCCLKIESSTSITFTIGETKTLTLIFLASEASKKIKIDGTNYTADSNGKVTVELAAGTHTITKTDTMNLFYLSLSGTTGITDIKTLSIWYSDNKIHNPVQKEISIFNVSGQKIAVSTDDFDLSNFPKGIYLLKIQGEYVRKIVR